VRALLQRVSEASVRVGGDEVGAVGGGLLVLLGVGHRDDERTARLLAEKVAGLRIFEDEQGKTNLSVTDVGGEVLVVSQFTLYADVRKGRRPSFTDAAQPVRAAELVEVFRDALEEAGLRTAAGQFAAHMEVSLINDGPFTIWLDSDELWGART
jgi:D-tyrosyl-tRNA(Tyr) deacylase